MTERWKTPLRILKIDFEELLLVLESSDNPFGTPIENYPDTETGGIIPLHDDFEDAEEVRERIDAGLSERYQSIEPLESRESLRIMEDFAASLPESRLKTRLFDALAQHARDWLEARGIEAELQRRRRWRRPRSFTCGSIGGMKKRRRTRAKKP